jgi:hypothetical protein
MTPPPLGERMISGIYEKQFKIDKNKKHLAICRLLKYSIRIWSDLNLTSDLLLMFKKVVNH